MLDLEQLTRDQLIALCLSLAQGRIGYARSVVRLLQEADREEDGAFLLVDEGGCDEN